jgi:hypothetical protein
MGYEKKKVLILGGEIWWIDDSCNLAEKSSSFPD